MIQVNRNSEMIYRISKPFNANPLYGKKLNETKLRRTVKTINNRLVIKIKMRNSNKCVLNALESVKIATNGH